MQAVITTRILQLVHELCRKRIHVTKRDLFYTGGLLLLLCLGAPAHNRTRVRLATVHCILQPTDV